MEKTHKGEGAQGDGVAEHSQRKEQRQQGAEYTNTTVLARSQSEATGGGKGKGEKGRGTVASKTGLAGLAGWLAGSTVLCWCEEDCQLGSLFLTRAPQHHRTKSSGR